VGVATAYYLAEDGHEVILFDRQPDLACETSYANAGLVSPGDSHAWASPAALKMCARSLYRRDLGIRMRPRLDPALWSWSWKFLFQCTDAKARVNTLRKLRLTLYSRQRHNALVADTGIDYDGRRDGIVYFFRTQESLDRGLEHMRLLENHGLRIEVVSRDELVGIEPALASVKDSLAGGIFSPMDQTGDAAKFTRALAAWCSEHWGVLFALNTVVQRLEPENGRIARALTDRGAFEADAFVLAAGSDSPALTRPLGVRLPIYPVKGYSATVPVREGDTAPAIGGVDEDKLVAFSRLGDRLRIAATAEFAGHDRTHVPQDFANLLATARELFPHGGDYDRAQYWAGLRPMTPSSVPIHGAARYPNLFLNVGHGHVGWTMAAGSGKLVADLIARRKPEIDPEGWLYAG
jgi:D-amino-acid dehydrogenase